MSSADGRRLTACSRLTSAWRYTQIWRVRRLFHERPGEGLCAGFEVLTAMERVPTDDDDRPLQEIRITGATVFVNPYKDEEEAERKAAEAARLKARVWPAVLACLAAILPPHVAASCPACTCMYFCFCHRKCRLQQNMCGVVACHACRRRHRRLAC